MIVSSNPQKNFFKIERVNEDSSSHQSTTCSKMNELYNKEEMDWVVMLINVLRSNESEDYAKHLLTYLETQIDRGISRLSPREFR